MVGFSLFIYCIIKFILIILAVSSPIPGGIILPTFTLGAVFGRLIGLCLKNIGFYFFGYSLIKCKRTSVTCLDEGIYAIVGAAALSGAVTRTTSIAMIVFEMNR